MAHRILIVDDDPDIHRMLAAAIEQPDRILDSAYDGEEGLRRAQAQDYDLVITDVNMPRLDGLAFLERLRKARPNAKAVVMTVANTPETIIRALREHAFAYFAKPFTLMAVSEMVERALAADPLGDDIEVLSASPTWLTLRLRCKLETGDRILQFLREMGTDLPAQDKESLAMAIREILVNAIEHGAGSDPDKKVIVTYVRGQRALFYYVRDPGKGFAMENLRHTALANPEQSPLEHVEVREQLGLRPGGFGILITRQIVDELIYNGPGNEVLLVKYLDGQESSTRSR